jgi:hypothetical protein
MQEIDLLIQLLQEGEYYSAEQVKQMLEELKKKIFNLN